MHSCLDALISGSCDSAGKESACNAGDLGSTPALGRSPGEGKGYPLQYSGLENFMDCIVHGVAKSWTQLNDFHFQDIYFPLVTKGFPGGSIVKNLPAVQETSSVPRLGRSSREGNHYPLQYSRLGNPMDRGAWLVTVHRLA